VTGKEIDNQQQGKIPLWQIVRMHLLEQIELLDPGASLPSYTAIAAELNCSLAPVKQAVRELATEGWISLQRGRPPRVLWNLSFTNSARRAGHRLTTKMFESSYRLLERSEAFVLEALELIESEPCIVCGRVRTIDDIKAALMMTYINPIFFAKPESFFLDHDLVHGSLRAIYSGLQLHPIRIPALIKPALANLRDQRLLCIDVETPVLHVEQHTWVEWKEAARVLEVMHATYTADIDYHVDRLSEWSTLESKHVSPK